MTHSAHTHDEPKTLFSMRPGGYDRLISMVMLCFAILDEWQKGNAVEDTVRTGRRESFIP